MTSGLQGYNYNFSLGISSPFQSLTMMGPVPDTSARTYGHSINTAATVTTAVIAATDVILLAGSSVRTAGNIVSVRVGATTAFTMSIVTLVPACPSGAYCAGACRSACTSTCATGTAAYCTSTGTCATSVGPTCSADVVGSSTSFTVTEVASVTGSAATSGFGVFLIPPVPVKEGVLLGFKTSATLQTSNSTNGDSKLGSTGVLVSQLAYTHDVRIVVQEHNTVALMPSFNCSKAAPVPTAAVPVPYGITTEDYTKNGTFLINFTMGSSLPVAAVSSSFTPICQVPIGNLTVQLEIWMAYGANLPYTVLIPQGSPIFVSAVIDTTTFYHYHDDAETSPFTWSPALSYALEGLYRLSGVAKNAISNATFSTLMHVVPNVTSSWVLVAICPCYDNELGFNFTLTFPSAAHPPWNATVTLTYSAVLNTGAPLNGSFFPSKLENFTTFDNVGPGGASGTAKPLALAYNAQAIEASGNYTVTANISNEVSSEVFTVMMVVEPAIRDVTCSLTWIQTGVEKPGSGVKHDIYITNMTTLVAPSCRTGKPLKWRLQVQPGNIEVIVNATAGFRFNNTYLMEGKASFTMSAYNTVQGWVVGAPVNITFVNRIEGFVLSDDGKLGKVNESKPIVSNFAILTPVSCMEISWGDTSPLETYGDPDICNLGSPGSYYRGYMTAPMDLSHIYSQEGVYAVKGKAFDSSVILYSEISEVVADVPCTMPEVSIINAETAVYAAPKSYRSYTLRVESATKLECNKTVTVKRYWNIYKVDNVTSSVLEEVIIKDKLKSWNFSTLAVTPLYLPLGHYKFKYTVDVNASKIIALVRSTYTYFEIIPSNLSAVIIAGSLKSLSRGFRQNILLEPGLLSSDPDAPNVTLADVTWYCRQTFPVKEVHQLDADKFPIAYNLQPIPDPLIARGKTGGGCFGVGPGMLTYSLNRILFEISSFYLDQARFEILAVVRKDTRRALAFVEIDVVPTPPPQVGIRCGDPKLCYSISSGQLVNPSLRLNLEGDCLDYCGSVYYYKWTVLTPDDTIAVIDEPGCNPAVKACKQSFATDLVSPSLSITPYLFELNPTFDQFTVRLTIVTIDQRVGYSQITIVKNKPPTAGSCRVAFAENFAMISSFTIICDSWRDPEDMGIDTYNYYYSEVRPDGTFLRSAMASTGQATLKAVLPVGYLSMGVEIWDVLQAYTNKFIQNVTVVMPTQSQVEAFKSGEKLQALSASGDTTMLAMFIKALNSVNSNANWTSLDMSAVGNKTKAELDALLMSLSESTNQQLASMKSTSSATNINQINVYADVLNSAVGGVLQNDLASYTIDMKTRESTLGMLEDISGSLSSIPVASPQQYEPFLKSSLNTMTALMKGMNTVLLNSSTAPPGDQKIAADLEYDGAIPDDPDMAIPQNMEEMQTKNIIGLTTRQAKSQITRINNVLKSVSSLIMGKLVKGEMVSTKAECGASIIIVKLGEETLTKGKLIRSPIDANTTIFLPVNFCPSRFIDGYSNCRIEFGLTLVVWPVITHFYPETRTYLSQKGRVIDLKVTSRGVQVDVKDLKKPIIMEIPRDYEELTDLDPLFVNVTENMNTHVPFVFHYYNVSVPFAALIIEIKPSNPNERLVLAIDHERFPLPGKYWKSFLVNDLPSRNGSQIAFVDTNENSNRTGRFIAGVGKLLNGANHENFTKKDLDKTFKSNYAFRFITSGCYFFNETQDEWTGDKGVDVSSANLTHTVCNTNHLTNFGTGYFPEVNQVNFDFYIANMGFVDNSTLYITFILLIVVYIIMMIWAHYKDKKDVERRGAVALPDNKPEDKYVYEITFHTGPDADAPCESNIFFIASGDYDETEIRALPPASPNLYRRYDRNTFVMTTPSPLGHIHYLRVFHDNTGRLPYDSWQLDRVVLRDLQTAEQYDFETNCWLAINRGDGLVDRIFLCANNNEDTTDFSQRMYNQANRGANQDNMWMSMFLRPIGSRFSRKERVTVCATFLYLSMLISAMFYQIEGESGYDAFTFVGPIPVSSSQVVKGVLVLLFAYPLCLLLSVIFKRARPRNLKRCRALESLEKQRKQQLIVSGSAETDAEVQSKVETIEKVGDPRRKVDPVVKCLPWWTRILAWVVAIAAILGSAFIVFAYGITWGEITTVKWFASFFSTFLVSVLVSQWLKILVFSICGSLCFKVDMSVEDIDCDEELPHLKKDEKWADLETIDPQLDRKVHRVRGVNANMIYHKLLHKDLTKEREMKFIVRGIMMYCIFLLVLLIIANDRTNINGFLLQNHLEDTFLRDGTEESGDIYGVKTTTDFWIWAQKLIMQEVRAQRNYNKKPPYGLKGFMNDQANRLMGYPILRQVRLRRFNCKVEHPLNSIIKDCTGTRGLLQEDSSDYCVGWQTKETFKGSCNSPEFKYETGTQLQTFAQWGRLGTYGAGGYVIRLNGNQEDVIKRLKQLQVNKWVDKRTRVIMLEFSIYNANVNLFATCFVNFEVNEGGGLVPKWRFEPVRLLRTSNAWDILTQICEILFVVATVFFTVRELWEMKRQKCSYFSQYWNMAELSIIAISYLEIGMYVYRKLLTQEALDEFTRTKGNSYIRMDAAVLVDQYYLFLLAFIMFVSILKLIKLLQFNKRMDVLALTIGLCWEELSYFFIAFGVIFFAFCALFYFLFITQLRDFSGLISAVQTSFSMMLGKFDFEEMKQANALSPLLFFIFSVTNSMVLVNIMLSIILKAFNDIKIDLQKKENRYDVMDYMWFQFKKIVVLQPNPVHEMMIDRSEKKQGMILRDNGNEQLPDKVSQLVEYINDVYFEGKLDINDSLAMKQAMANQKRSKFARDDTERKVFIGE